MRDDYGASEQSWKVCWHFHFCRPIAKRRAKIFVEHALPTIAARGKGN